MFNVRDFFLFFCDVTDQLTFLSVAWLNVDWWLSDRTDYWYWLMCLHMMFVSWLTIWCWCHVTDHLVFVMWLTTWCLCDMTDYLVFVVWLTTWCLCDMTDYLVFVMWWPPGICVMWLTTWCLWCDWPPGVWLDRPPGVCVTWPATWCLCDVTDHLVFA